MSSAEIAPVETSIRSAVTAESNVVTPDVLQASKGAGDTSNVVPSRQIRMQDLLRVVQSDDRFHEVTVEQIERVKMSPISITTRCCW